MPRATKPSSSFQALPAEHSSSFQSLPSTPLSLPDFEVGSCPSTCGFCAARPGQLSASHSRSVWAWAFGERVEGQVNTVLPELFAISRCKPQLCCTNSMCRSHSRISNQSSQSKVPSEGLIPAKGPERWIPTKDSSEASDASEAFPAKRSQRKVPSEGFQRRNPAQDSS